MPGYNVPIPSFRAGSPPRAFGHWARISLGALEEFCLKNAGKNKPARPTIKGELT